MAETDVVIPDNTQPAPIVEKNPFDENSWTSSPDPTPDPAPVAVDPTPVSDPAPIPDADKIIAPDEWVKEYYGWDNAEMGKKELEELRKLKEQAQTPAEIKFANDEAKRYFEAITNGKVDDLYNILHQQRQLDRLEKLTLANASEAAEVIKANLQYKHKDLTPDEVNFLYNKRYALPAKPQQGEQSDEDYAIQLEGWKQAVQEKEQEIVIEAKLAKPELAKYKSELVLPDIPKPQPQPTGPTQESLAAIEAARNGFLQKLESEYKNFKGFESKVKDESVEIPIAFNVPDEEKTALYNELKDFDVNEFFEARWFDEKGNPKVDAMMSDLYLLKNPGKVFQGISNNAASKRLDHHLKERSNIKIDPTGQPVPSTNGVNSKELEEKTIWSA